jgi:hypothetical protein
LSHPDAFPRIEQFALLPLDGDMYESTMETLAASCAAAVHDFRARRGITECMRQIDWSGVYWQKKPHPVR